MVVLYMRGGHGEFGCVEMLLIFAQGGRGAYTSWSWGRENGGFL